MMLPLPTMEISQLGLGQIVSISELVALTVNDGITAIFVERSLGPDWLFAMIDDTSFSVAAQMHCWRRADSWRLW